MSVKIGSARIDEKGNAKGGKAGNQNGKELSSQTWYLHKKGWRVFRCKDPNKADLIAKDMIYAINNKNIGYDQSQRNTLYNTAKEYNFDCSKVNKPCECDCSSLVRVCCAYAGIILSAFNTSNEGKVLLSSGYFIELKDKKYTNESAYLKKGDILVTKTQGHTVVVLSNGSEVENIDFNFTKVMVTAKSVFIRKSPDKMSLAVGVGYCGDEFDLIRQYNDDWYLIKYDNENRYITTKYTVMVN